MRQWTYLELKTKVENDLDLKEEKFVVAAEMLDYCNEAIREAEAEIHSIYEDYFLTSTTLTLVPGTSGYSMPSDLYANKIRRIVYSNLGISYAIPRLRNHESFELLPLIQTPYRYMYLIKNDATLGRQITFYPTIRAEDSGSSAITVWYLRNAKKLTSDTDVLDIPEFANFIMQFMKTRCYEKEGHPNTEFSVNVLQQQRKLMVDTLSTMVPDNDDVVEMDMGIYNDHS